MVIHKQELTKFSVSHRRAYSGKKKSDSIDLEKGFSNADK